MKVPADWLQEYLTQKFDVREMAEALELAGIEVEQIIYPKKLDKNIVVADVKKVTQHPNADRLHLVSVDAGTKVYEVVCGAPNVRPGLRVAFAKIGTVLPDGSLIEKATLRGVESNGMLCSEHELGLGDNHDGILELDPSLPLGKTLCDIVDLPAVVDISTHANRPDLQSIIGLAREIAAVKGGEVRQPELETAREGGRELEVELCGADLVRRYVVEKLTIGKSHSQTPGWMQKRLMAAGVRPINLIVDITNYVMLEYGQPLHAFDAAHVRSPLSVRMARKNEKLITLDGQTRELSDRDLVIADKRGPIGLAGIMGGTSSEITPDTKEIILESATFDSATIRKSAIRHGVRTEASSRFERGLPVQLAPLALARAVKLLEELAEATSSSQTTDKLQVWPWVQHIGVRVPRLSSLLGRTLDAETTVAALKRLDFDVAKFDIVAEAKAHLGKPYVFGASYKTHGLAAFDCSYLTDYLYSLIGLPIGHTAHQQFRSPLGEAVNIKDLKPGDLLFRGGPFEKRDKAEREGVSHVAMYIGDNQIIHAKDIERGQDGGWIQIAEPSVQITSADEVILDPEYLGARRFSPDLSDYVAVRTVPWWRPDVKTEEDIAEEVARMLGYSALPATLPAWRPSSIKFDQQWPRIWSAKSVMSGYGLFEVMTYSFVSAAQIEAVGYKISDHLKLKNPMSVEQAYLRRNLLASLLTVVERNQTYSKDFGLFELSRVFIPKKDHGQLPDEPTRLAVAIRGEYARAKGAFDLLVREFGPSLTLKPVAESVLHPGRSAKVLHQAKSIGLIGQVHPSILATFGISGPVSYLELDWEAFIAASRPKQYHEISRFPAVVRDLSILVKDDIVWADIEAVVADSGLAQPQFLSEYHGAELPKGRKAVALRLSMTASDRTLTDADAADRIGQLSAALKKHLGAEPRS